MSLRTDIGPQGNLLSEEPQVVNHVELEQPILTDFELERLRRNPYGALDSTTIDITFPLDKGEDGLEDALDRIRAQAIEAVQRRHHPARPLRPGDRAPTGCRSPPCSPAPPSTTRSSARAPGCAPRSWSSRASRASSITSRR